MDAITQPIVHRVHPLSRESKTILVCGAQPFDVGITIVVSPHTEYWASTSCPDCRAHKPERGSSAPKGWRVVHLGEGITTACRRHHWDGSIPRSKDIADVTCGRCLRAYDKRQKLEQQ